MAEREIHDESYWDNLAAQGILAGPHGTMTGPSPASPAGAGAKLDFAPDAPTQTPTVPEAGNALFPQITINNGDNLSVGGAVPNRTAAAFQPPSLVRPVLGKPTFSPSQQQNPLTPGGALDIIEKYESGGRNVPNYRYDPTHTAQGYWQITNSTWREAAPRAGVDINQYPTAMSAPKDIQRIVAGKLFEERGFQPWAPYNPKLASAVGYQTGLHAANPKMGPLGSGDFADLMNTAPQQNTLAPNKVADSIMAAPQPQPQRVNPLAMMALLTAGTHKFVPINYDPFKGIPEPAGPVTLPPTPTLPVLPINSTPVAPSAVAKSSPLVTSNLHQFYQGLG